MNSIDLLRDAFGRVAEQLPEVLEGLDATRVSQQPAPGTNSVGWLLWHLARVEDSHLADLARALDLGDGSQVLHDGWQERLGLPYPDGAHGYGMSAEDVARFHVEDPQVLAGYHAAVHRRTLEVLDAVEAAGGQELLDRVVDDSWDPPVTAGVRLVSVVNDTTQHVGQAAYLKGLLQAG